MVASPGHAFGPLELLVAQATPFCHLDCEESIPEQGKEMATLA